MKSPADPFETVLPAPMVAPVPVRIPGMALGVMADRGILKVNFEFQSKNAPDGSVIFMLFYLKSKADNKFSSKTVRDFLSLEV